MKVITLIITTLIVVQCEIFTQPYIISENVKRIVFLGNSITYKGDYIAYIDAFVTLKYPSHRYEIINMGLPSETLSGFSEPGHAGGKFPRPDLHERLDRILAKMKPDLVFACYGMNDGIYLPFDDERFNKYKEGILWLHDQVLKSGASLIFITPPVYDVKNGLAYSNVLDIYSNWLISLRLKDNWKIIDIYWPLKQYVSEYQMVDSTFSYSNDGIHPNEIGHFFIAKQILLSLGESELNTANNIYEALMFFQNRDTILKLVEKRQEILKDAWLTYIGHKRPEMKKGLSLEEAGVLTEELNARIYEIIKP